jgi:hypothetical protein
VGSGVAESGARSCQPVVATTDVRGGLRSLQSGAEVAVVVMQDVACWSPAPTNHRTSVRLGPVRCGYMPPGAHGPGIPTSGRLPAGAERTGAGPGGPSTGGTKRGTRPHAPGRPRRLRQNKAPAAVTTYILPGSAAEAAALSDRLISQLPSTVQLLTDAVDVTLKLKAADPYVLHYYADGRPDTPPAITAAVATSLSGVLPPRRGDFGRVRAVFEEDGRVELISAWDNIIGHPAPDAVLHQLLAILTRAWRGPGTTSVRTTMAASSLARVLSQHWRDDATEALDALQNMLLRIQLLHPDD